MESNESYPADTRRPARSGLDDFSGGPQLQAKLVRISQLSVTN